MLDLIEVLNGFRSSSSARLADVVARTKPSKRVAVAALLRAARGIFAMRLVIVVV
jgi:hypothetical protein